MANYTVRDNTAQIDVAITGGPGNETWTVTAAPPFNSGHFQETGSGSKTLTGPIIDGRDYRLIVDPIDGYDWGPISDVTADKVAPQTFTVAMSADVPVGDLTITLSGPGSGQGWTVTGPSYPTGLAGNGSTILNGITQGDYDIVYDDDDISLTSPPPDSLTLGTSAEFTGTYTTRNTFVVDVCVTDDGGTPTGAFGLWEIVNEDGFGLSDFTAIGDWDTNNNPVNPSAGDFYEGREYTLTFTPEVGYDPVDPITITEAAPGGGGISLDFWSDWRTATGTSSTAYNDGGKWTANPWNVGNEVVSATGLGFPASMANVFVGPNITQTGEGGSVAICDGWPMPAIGEALAVRFYVRHDLDNLSGGDYSNGSHHPVQPGTGDIAYSWSWKWGLRANDDIYQIQFTSLDASPVYYGSLGGDIAKGTVLMMEHSFERVGPADDDWRIRAKLSDANGTEIDSVDSGTISCNFHQLLSNSNCGPTSYSATSAMVGWSGPGWNCTGENYWGGFAVAITNPGEWIGAYPTADEGGAGGGCFEGAYLTSQAGACDAFAADVTVSGNQDWSSTYALTPASATTGTADFYLKPSALGMDASILFGKTATINTYDHPVEIRFNASSRIDVSNAVGYCSGGGNPLCTTDVPYEVDHWYHFVVDFDVANKLCTVQVEDCNDGLVVLEQSADFRSQSAPNDDQIGYWAITTWSNVGSFALYTGNGNTDMEWTSGGGGTPPPTTGDITVNTSPQTATWTLTGPSAYSYNGTGTEPLTGLEFGDYDLTCHPLSGYNEPGPGSVTLGVSNTPYSFFKTWSAAGTQSKTIYGIGHSLLSNSQDIRLFTQRVVAAVSSNSIADYDEQNIPGASLWWNWDPDTNGGVVKGRNALATGAWSALLFTENNGIQASGNTAATIRDGGAWRDLARAGWTGTPDCEAWFFTHWSERSGSADYDGGTDPDQAWRDHFAPIGPWGDAVVAGINADNPNPPLCQHIPTGPVYMAALYDEIYKVGGSPIQTAGLTKINDIFKKTDPNGNPVAGDRVHLNNIGRYYQALVHAAHMFSIDIRGAYIEFTNQYGNPAGPDKKPDPTTDQMTALQNLVHSIWSTQ